MAPFTRPSIKKRRIAAKGKSTAKKTTPGGLNTQAVPSPPLADSSTSSDDTELLVDELDGILELPGDGDEAMELQDNGETQVAVVTASNEMKLKYGVTLSDKETKDARDLFPKVRILLYTIHSLTDFLVFYFFLLIDCWPIASYSQISDYVHHL
jgi:hypothetical protein